MDDYDSPWKEALDYYLPAFLLLLYPHIHADIDWSRGYEALDKELQKVAPKAERGRRYVDKLFKVWLKDGAEAYVLIHVEVQLKPEKQFPHRMFVYNRRIGEGYNREVVSLAVLADDDPAWRPDHYEEGRWGCRASLDFLPTKLLDFAGREAELEADKNPFAKVVLAHLKARQTRRDPDERRAWKFRLVRGLYERGFKAEDVRKLFRLIDWLMELPPAVDDLFWQDVESYKESRRMPFITTPERMGIKKGQLRSIESILRGKFGDNGLLLMEEVRLLNDTEKYDAFVQAVATAESLEDVRKAIAEAAAPKKKSRRSRNDS